jgi:hypothetical protein
VEVSPVLESVSCEFATPSRGFQAFTGQLGVDDDLDLPYDKWVGGAQLDKRLVREYRDRWRAVTAINLAEQQCSPVSRRLQQMDAIYRLAVGLHLRERGLSEEESAGYERWAQVKRRVE